MTVARIAEKDLLNADEMALFTLSQDAAALQQHSPTELRDKIARARNLRDRARDVYRRQIGRTRATTGIKRGFTDIANERSRQKAEVLQTIVEKLTHAREQQLA